MVSYTYNILNYVFAPCKLYEFTGTPIGGSIKAAASSERYAMDEV